MIATLLILAASTPSPGPPSINVAPGTNSFSTFAESNSEQIPRVQKAHGSSGPQVPSCADRNVQPCIPMSRCEPDPNSLTGFTIRSYSGGTIDWVDGPCRPGQAADLESLPALVLRAFQAIPLPEATLSIQPPGGKTLVGLETILSTQAAPFTRRVTLLGQQIELRIRAQRFTWTHGDATTQSTDWPGKPWNEHEPDIDGYLTHTYEHTGVVRPSVTVTWEADYRVGGGPWQPVNGTVRREGAPAELQVVQAQPVLNGY